MSFEWDISNHNQISAFLFGDQFVFLKDGHIQMLGDDESPWDRHVLERIYDTEMDTVPYGKRAIIVPRNTHVGVEKTEG